MLELRGLGVELLLQLRHPIVLDAGLRLDVLRVRISSYIQRHLSELHLFYVSLKRSMSLQSSLES